MTDQALRVVPAGWYEDPASSAHVRWWNGLAWTEHTAAKPVTPPPTAASTGSDAASGQAGTDAATAARIAEARELERQYGISTEEHDVIVRSATEGAAAVDSRSGYLAGGYGAGSGWDAEDEPLRRPRRSATSHAAEHASTVSSWLVALWPVFTAVAVVAAAYVYFYVSPEPAFVGIPIVAGLVVVPYLLQLIWAIADARRLRLLGQDHPGAAFALLGPLVYLIARRVKVPGNGPLVALLVFTLAIGGGMAAAWFTGAAAPATKALEIQLAAQEQFVGSGELVSVTCPVLVESAQTGDIYTCSGVRRDGSEQLVWVSIDSADGDFSLALGVR